MTDSRESAQKRYPYDPFEGLYNEAVDVLRMSGRKAGKTGDPPRIPTFARSMLEQLRDVGLLHRTDIEPPVNARRVRVDNNQNIWVRFDTYRDYEEGYMAVEVVDAPRSDAAILAAMIAWLARPINFEQLLEAQRFILSGAAEAQQQEIDAAHQRVLRGEQMEREEFISIFKSTKDLQDRTEPAKPLFYLVPLIRHYRPEAKNYSEQEFSDLLRQACSHINDFLDSLRKLQGFLEYGAPNRKLEPAIEDPDRDVRAAVLKDVHELTYLQIGELLGMPPSRSDKIKGDNQRVSRAVTSGREILEEAFAEEGGWQKKAETMRAERAWWQSLTEEERTRQHEIEMDVLASDGFL